MEVRHKNTLTPRLTSQYGSVQAGSRSHVTSGKRAVVLLEHMCSAFPGGGGNTHTMIIYYPQYTTPYSMVMLYYTHGVPTHVNSMLTSSAIALF